MSSSDLAQAMQRFEAALTRRPEFGLHDDAPAQATLLQGTMVRVQHPSGAQVVTDMPAEFAGTGALPTPGWHFRAGLTACAATSIAMLAATREVTLSQLAIRAESRSDSCGLFGLPAANGALAGAAPVQLRMTVEIASPHRSPTDLRALVDTALERSPIPSLVRRAMKVELVVDARQG